MPISEAAEITGIPRTSAAKIKRVFGLIDSGIADDEIAADVKDFSTQTVAGIRSAYAETQPEPGATNSIKSFLDAHRMQLHRLAVKFSRSISSDVEPWPSGWLRDKWARPWTGTVDEKPTLEHESEPRFSYMLDHLKKSKIKEALRQVESCAQELRLLAEKIEQGLPRGARSELSDDMLNAAILYGSQLAETPDQEYPNISLTVEHPGVTLRMDAFSERYSDATDAESAAAALRKVIECVKSDPTTGKFYAVRTEARDVLKRLLKAFEVGESVNLEIDQATCIACEALEGSGQTGDTPRVVV